MRVVGVGAGGSGVFTSTGSATFGVGTIFAYVAIFLAFIASYWFLKVFVHHDAGVGNENTLHKEFIGCFGGGANNFHICSFLVGCAVFGFLDPRCCNNRVGGQVEVLFDVTEVVSVRRVEVSVTGDEFHYYAIGAWLEFC